MHINSTILLIGSGRLAQHLKYWNSLVEKPNRLLFWDRSQGFTLLNEHLSNSQLIWLAVSDSAIVPFFDTHLKNHLEILNKKVVHFSGALHSEHMACAHPLMSFPSALLPKETYSKVFFVIEGCETVADVLPGFRNQFAVLNPDNKTYYHALCVLAGNFPQLLWNEVAHKFKQLNLPPEALDLYVKQITDNYLLLKEKALTGPVIRKDYATIERNLAALNESPNLKNIYSTLVKEFNR